MAEPQLNPFKPGAGHPPPHLAGRKSEKREFRKLLQQDTILENLVLTGLRGTGKTVLLDTAFKPTARGARWLWCGADLSESASISESTMSERILADLAVVTSGLVLAETTKPQIGFTAAVNRTEHVLSYDILRRTFDATPGLISDKLKAALRLAGDVLKQDEAKGIIFAYDEAQTIADHQTRDSYPLSMLLDVFQSLQKQGYNFMLVLVGLPTLFPKLVEARTYSERMFRVLFLDRLNENESREAIVRPIKDHPVKLDKESVQTVISLSSGYPYFIQFICRETYDRFSRGVRSVPTKEIIRKLDNDFFAGRWARATDRQRDLLSVVATHLDTANGEEFAVQDVATLSGTILTKRFSPSHISQMLVTLANAGLIYKNRYGRYSFAVPLMGQFILRQIRGESR